MEPTRPRGRAPCLRPAPSPIALPSVTPATDPSPPLTTAPDTPWRLALEGPIDPEVLAVRYYGHPEWAVLIPVAREVVLWPEQLTPAARADFEVALRAAEDRWFEALDGLPHGDRSGALLARLVAWAEAPKSPRLAQAFRRVLTRLAGSDDPAAYFRLASFADRPQAALLGRLINLAAQPASEPRLVRTGVEQAAEFLLRRLDGPTFPGEAEEMATLLLTLEPALAAQVLAQVEAAAERPGWLPTSRRYGEVTARGMRHFLFEDLRADDRERVLLHLAAVLPPERLSELRAGRGLGQLLPASTSYAQLAVEHWSQASLQTNASVGATLLGLGASLWLPETVGSTIAALGLRGLPGVLLRSYWVRALGAAQAVNAGVADLQAGVTGTDPLDGRRLRSDERLARWLSFGAGVVLFGTGAKAHFGEGRVRVVEARGALPAQAEPGYQVVAKEGAWEIQVPSRGAVVPPWPRLDERNGGAVPQLRPDSCVAACAEMLSEARISQAQVIERLGTPSSLTLLPPLLGRGWRAGYVRPGDLPRLLGLGRPFGAELNPGGILSHAVVVDGPKADGLVAIRDPDEGGRSYAMSAEDLLRYWTGHTVFE